MYRADIDLVGVLVEGSTITQWASWGVVVVIVIIVDGQNFI